LWKDAAPVLLNVSALSLFGVALLVMIRYRVLSLSSAIVAGLFGFYLAATGLAPTVNHALAALAHALANIH
jgi:hypothetical protein